MPAAIVRRMIAEGHMLGNHGMTHASLPTLTPEGQRKEISDLREFPESGAQLLPLGKERCPYRFLVCGNYLIFYHTDRITIMVDRVLYGRWDYLALLFSDELTDEDE